MPLFYAFLCVFTIQTPTKYNNLEDQLGELQTTYLNSVSVLLFLLAAFR